MRRLVLAIALVALVAPAVLASHAPTFTKTIASPFTGEGSIGYASWTPDGDFITGRKDDGGSRPISLFSVSGSTFTFLQELSPAPSSVRTVTWNPDGVTLAVAATGGVLVYVRAGNTIAHSTTLNVCTSGAASQGVAWSANGTYLASVCTFAPNVHVWSYDGATFTPLSVEDVSGGPQPRNPSWSPAADVLTVPHTSGFAVYSAAGSTVTKVTNDIGAAVYGAVFSPDGNYCVTNADSSWTAYTVSGTTFTSVDGGTLSTGTSVLPAWSPDGALITFSQQTTPYTVIVERDGNAFDPIANPDTAPTTAPSETTWSPDGAFATWGLSLYAVDPPAAPPAPPPDPPLLFEDGGLLGNESLNAQALLGSSDATTAFRFIMGLLFVSAIGAGIGAATGMVGAIVASVAGVIFVTSVGWWPVWVPVFAVVISLAVFLWTRGSPGGEA